MTPNRSKLSLEHVDARPTCAQHSQFQTAFPRARGRRCLSRSYSISRELGWQESLRRWHWLDYSLQYSGDQDTDYCSKWVHATVGVLTPRPTRGDVVSRASS